MKQINHRHNFKIAKWVPLLLLTFLLAGIVYYYSFSPVKTPVLINEICSNNFSLIQDDHGQYSDYIELYNPSDETVLLEGCYLSDDENQLQKLSLDSVRIPPKGYYVVWLAKDTKSQEVSAEFSISKYGETIYLSDSIGGEILDSVTVPKLSYNTCYGRINDGGAEWAEMTDTPGRSNVDADILSVISLDVPVFNVESGFYDEPFELVITAPEGSTVYYTLDGGNPTCDSYIYQAPLVIDDASQNENVYAARTDLGVRAFGQYTPSFLVDKATIVRAVSYNSENNTVSEVATKVYFVGYNDRSEYDDLPVISIVTDPDNLFDAEIGIYGNGVALEQYKEAGGMRDGELLPSYTDQNGVEHWLYMASNAFNEGRAWEREASLSYFDNLHDLCFTQDVGIRIAGDSTRTHLQKSISIYGRDIYDKNVTLPYMFFPDTVYSSIKLRNGGNRNDKVMFTDAFLEELAEDRNISIQRSTPCIMFLNGEYWGIYNIRERYKEEFFSNHYGVREDNIWMVDGNVSRIGEDEAQEAYQFMLAMVKECDLSYEDVYDMMCSIIDVQSLIDWYCINLYVGNTDVTLEHNIALWRTIETEKSIYGDGRWRWMIFDMDNSLAADSDISWLKNDGLMVEPFIISLMENEQFRKQFCITFMDLANTNYAYETVHAKLTEWEEIYQEQIVKTNQRFYGENYDEETFHSYITEIDDFFKNRFPHAMEGLAYAFDLAGELDTIIVENNDIDGGIVTVNTAQLDGYEQWSGQYFTDYPIVLTATPKEGYRFTGWSGDINSQENAMEIELPEGGFSITAIFERID